MITLIFLQFFSIQINLFKEILIKWLIHLFKRVDMISTIINLFRTQFKITKEWIIQFKNIVKFKEQTDQCKKLLFIIKINLFNTLIDIKINLYQWTILLIITYQFNISLNIPKNKYKINRHYMISQVSILWKIQIREFKKWSCTKI